MVSVWAVVRKDKRIQNDSSRHGSSIASNVRKRLVKMLARKKKFRFFIEIDIKKNKGDVWSARIEHPLIIFQCKSVLLIGRTHNRRMNICAERGAREHLF